MCVWSFLIAICHFSTNEWRFINWNRRSDSSMRFLDSIFFVFIVSNTFIILPLNLCILNTHLALSLTSTDSTSKRYRMRSPHYFCQIAMTCVNLNEFNISKIVYAFNNNFKVTLSHCHIFFLLCLSRYMNSFNKS